LKEKDTRYCARCKKSTKKITLYAKFIGKGMYCKVCHCMTKNGQVIGGVNLRYGTTFKNDFARHLLNDYHTPLEYFSVADIINYLRNGTMQMNKLPPDVAKGVREELEITGNDLKRMLRKSKKYFTAQMKMQKFSINDIIDSLNHGFLQLDKLPPKIAKQVQKELHNSSINKMDESTIYFEYRKMRKRERELLREHKLVEKAFRNDDDFIESSRRLKIVGKKLNEIAREKGFT